MQMRVVVHFVVRVSVLLFRWIIYDFGGIRLLNTIYGQLMRERSTVALRSRID